MKSAKGVLILAAVGLVVAGAFILRATRQQESPSESAAERAEPPRQAPTLVELGSDRCTSCKAMVPVLDELRQTHGCALNVRFIDVWKDPEEGARFDVSVIPTQVLLGADGTELERHTGFWSAKAIRAAFASHGQVLAEASGSCEP